MKEYDTFIRAQDLLGARFERVARGGRFDAILPKPGVGLILVGGVRNPKGRIAASTRNGLHAAFTAVLRAQSRLERAIASQR